ncbi:GH92 family glycosyl hydrolase [Microbacterium sp. Clip185]|uniref:GH92 family glycosyl hydrolase n=1 Tax=Microbacterium sp. Clip185 TaxID=3025663 RepID=UPI002366BAC2|nr:GH92 family glycosyl hydrolase [Microbacterium sp. Clip185]WDG17791.1 GH92 family glycosyl hydrolase [Microbacterium sp. Clip185]
MTTLELFPDEGPASPPAAAAGAGISGGACFGFRAPAVGAARSTLPGWAHEPVVAEGDELVWAVMPAFDEAAVDVRDGFRAGAVAIDLVTDDGRRLLDVVGVETDGTRTAADSRVDVDFPDQWNERRVPLSALAGTRILRAELVVDPPMPRRETGAALRGWVDGVRIEHSRASSVPGATVSPSDRVSTTRGSHSSPERSRGNTQPFAGVPHGGFRIAPATDLSNGHWTYTWNAHGPGPDPALAGMLVSRSPSIWIGERGALAIRIGLEPDDRTGVAAEPFSHDDEEARPHRYRLRTLSGIRIDAAATGAAAVIEIDMPRPGLIALTAPGSALDDVLPLEDATAVTVAATSVIPSPHEPDPVRSYHHLRLTGVRVETDGRGADAVLCTTAPRVRIELAASQISARQARIAAEDVAGVPIEDIARRARELWDEMLSVVEVSGAGELPALVASDLARLFLFPTRHDEDTPEGSAYPSPTERDGPDTAQHTGRVVRAGRMMTDHGFWDTYRTCWPAFALLAPARAGALLDAMLEHVRDAGWSPRWTAGTPLDAMVGTSLDVVSADLLLAGIGGFDQEQAYIAGLRNATTVSDDARFGRKGQDAALVRGWVPAEVHESVSWTLEGCVSDAAAAVLARARARSTTGAASRRAHAEARFLAHRAHAYRSLWDSSTGFFRPRRADGSWADEPFDPRVWGGGHTETNAWGSRFGVPHDGAGLARLLGGREGLGEALDALFETPETARAAFAGSYGRVIHEMPEARDIRRGMWALSNQPAHHVPWLYAHSDRPWRTNDIVTDAVDRLFRGSRIGQGYPGDEDNGEMSAWHLLAVIGLAPFPAGSGSMLWTAPRRARTKLRPIGAAPTEIVTHRRDDADRYIRAVRRDGRPWTSPTVGIADLHAGGRWDIELGSQPVAWSEPLPALPHFAPDGVTQTMMRDAVDTVSISRSFTRRFARLTPGRWRVEAGVRLDVSLDDGPRADQRALLVLGLDEAGQYSFTVETAPGVVLGAFSDEQWPWARQVRPFELDLPAACDRVRIVWRSGPAHLWLMQMLVDEV